MKTKLLFALAIFLNLTIIGQTINEAEPNNSIATANNLPQAANMIGTVGATGDTDDYFRALPNDDGTLKITLQYTNGGAGTHPGIFLYAYNKNSTQIGTKFIYSIAVGTHTDSLIIHCRANDTMYFRLNATQAIGYNMSFVMIPSGTADVEPNNNFAQATFVPHSTNASGRINYIGSVADGDDYFKAYLPAGGTFKLYTNYNNTSGSTGAGIFIYVHNKNQTQIGNKFLYSRPLGASPTDTITIHCREQDTLYIRYNTSGCFSYTFSYEVINQHPSDAEPNDGFAQASYFAPTDTIKGRIGYNTTATDNNDYFKTYMPNGGTFKLYTNYNNTSGSTGSGFFIYVYNSSQSQIGSQFLYSRPLGINPTDTLTIHCRDIDTIFVRINSSGCFAYSMTHEIIAPGPNDIEPNNTFAQAQFVQPTDTTVGRIGHIGAVNDNNDYFKTYLPAGGTFKLYTTYNNSSGSTGSGFFTYIHNRNQTQIGNKFLYSRPLGVSPTDTITIHCREQDTLYIRYNTSGCFSYSFWYEIIDQHPVDIEPNNAFAEATFFAPTDTVNGRIGYITTATDNNDYFKTYLPDGGTFKLYTNYNNTSGSASSGFFIYVYNKNSSQIGSKFLYSRPLGINPTDTITLHCREQDTIYVRYNSSGCFSYNFFYEVINHGPNDIEPNNSLATAQLINTDSTLQGRINYITTTADNNDYFKFYNPSRSNLTIYLEANNTSASNSGAFYFYAYRGNGAQIFYKPLTGLAQGVRFDTIQINCLLQDTIYLRVTSSGCFSYKMDFDNLDNTPNAQIRGVRTGNLVAFTANIRNASSFVWNFGDGTTSNLRYPKKEFGIGTYYVTLTAQNAQCNLTHVDTFFVEVKGIEYYTPLKSGAGGDAMMQIFGGGLDTNTTIVLKRPGIEIKPILKYGNPARNELQVLLDLHFANEGMYDVEIQIPGEPLITFTNGFEVEDFEYPLTYSEIIGPSLWRVNVNTRYVLTVGNRGNVKANGVLAFMIWPKNVDVKFDTEWFRPPDSGAFTINLNPEILELDYKDIQVFYDSAYMVPTPIDSFAGQPYDGYMKIIQIAAIAPGGTYDIPFIARAKNTGSLNFITYTSKPNLFGSCGNGTWMDMSENLAVEAIDAMDMGLGLANLDKTPLGWLTKAVKGTTKHMANLGQAMGATYNYLDGTTNSIYESLPADYMSNVDAGNMQMAGAVLEVGTDYLVGKGAQNYGKGTSQDINKWMANNPEASLKSFEFAVDNLNNINDVRNFIENAYKTGKDLKTLGDKLSRLQELAKDCPELEKQLKDLQKELDKEMQQREKKEKRTNTVNSFDPNAIYGPTGVATQQFVNHIDKQSFMVTFENVDTATASAQIVTIQVPLDTVAFDMRSFSFGDFAIGTEGYTVPKNRKEFTVDVDFKKSESYFVRVLAYLDTTTGIINCQFITLDTTTLELPIVEGFLPPNVNAPEGEGSITYSIALKPTITDGYQTTSIAEIIFDQNEPIFTDPWSNVIDRIPSSSMAASSIENDSIVIDFNGNDATSGVDFYYLYVSVDGGEWISLTGTPEDKMKLLGEPGKKYDFYALSIDKVANEEVKTPTIESSVTVPFKSESDFQPEFIVIPNPNTGTFELLSNGNFENTETHIINSMGQIVDQLKLSFIKDVRTPITLRPVASGVYTMRIKAKNGKVANVRLVIVRE